MGGGRDHGRGKGPWEGDGIMGGGRDHGRGTGSWEGDGIMGGGVGSWEGGGITKERKERSQRVMQKKKVKQLFKNY